MQFLKLSIIAIVLMAQVLPAHAQKTDHIADIPPYVLCQKDTECVALMSVCGMWVGVNKIFKEEAKATFRELSEYQKCKPETLKKPKNMGCNNKQCDIRPDKRNCMLYDHAGLCQIQCQEVTEEGFCLESCRRGVDC